MSLSVFRNERIEDRRVQEGSKETLYIALGANYLDDCEMEPLHLG